MTWLAEKKKKEAAELDGVKPETTKKSKKTVAVIPEAPVKKRGRPAKASVTA